MTSKLSRSALIAAIAVGASGLVAVPAASAADTQYYVNSPVVSGATNVTPESVVLNGVVDTGGSPGIEFPVAGTPGGLTTLPWVGGVNIINSTGLGTAASENFWIEGLPDNGSNNLVTIGTKQFSNAGADNYSNVEFEVDPVADYNANGSTPGSETVFGDSMQVPTQQGLTAVHAAMGAFGMKAQANSSQSPLKPGTKYYYWIVDQAGTTDNAEDVNTGTAASPSYSCYPNAYVAAFLAADTVQGPCVYQYGNNNGVDFYQSPNGTFTTPKLGKIAIGANAKVNGGRAMLSVADMSGFRASGQIQLKRGGRVIASTRFNLAPGARRMLSLTLNGKGMKAAKSHAKAELVLTSEYDQPTSTKQVRL